VTFSGFRNGEDATHVYRTINGGRRWRNISRNLPNAPVNDVVLDGRNVYVGSDVGVLTMRNGQQGGWRPVGAGLPLVRCSTCGCTSRRASCSRARSGAACGRWASDLDF
jgi:hypothetical protein